MSIMDDLVKRCRQKDKNLDCGQYFDGGMCRECFCDWLPGAIAKAQRDMLMELKAIGTEGIETEADELHVRMKLLSHIQALIDKLNKVIGGK